MQYRRFEKVEEVEAVVVVPVMMEMMEEEKLQPLSERHFCKDGCRYCELFTLAEMAGDSLTRVIVPILALELPG